MSRYRRTAVFRASIALAACGLAAAAIGSSPAWAAEAVSSQVDPAHSGYSADPLTPPLGKRWQRDLGEQVATPLIAEGKVFVFVRPEDDGPAELVALSASNGSDLWRRSFDRRSHLTLAYGGGRVYVTDFEGRLHALSAQSGRDAWTATALGVEGEFLTPPMATGGLVYAVGTAPLGPRLYALRQADGAVEWLGLAEGASPAAPAADAQRIYIGTGCESAQAFDRGTGISVWSYATECVRSTKGGMPAVHAGRVYAPGDFAGNGVVLDAATGTLRDRYPGTGHPAFAGEIGLFQSGSLLLARNLSSGSTRWAVSPSERPYRGQFADSPLVVGQHAYSRRGDELVVHGLDTGAPAWTAWLGTSYGSSSGIAGANAGEGLLLIPNDEELVAFHQGPNGAGLRTDRPRPVPSGARVSLYGSPRDVGYGQVIRLAGDSFGVDDREPYELEADPAPFDDRFITIARGQVGSRGYSFRLRPTRNTRYRINLPGYQTIRSETVTVHSDWRARIRFRPRGRRRLTTTVTALHARDHRLAGRALHFYYYDRSARRTARRATKRLRRVSSTRSRARATFRIPVPGRGDYVFVCYRERQPDPWGKPRSFLRRCGAPRL